MEVLCLQLTKLPTLGSWVENSAMQKPWLQTYSVFLDHGLLDRLIFGPLIHNVVCDSQILICIIQTPSMTMMSQFNCKAQGLRLRIVKNICISIATQTAFHNYCG